MREERMSKKEGVSPERKRLEYETPLFEKQITLNFPEKIWERLNGGKFQQTCSRCHHCR